MDLNQRLQHVTVLGAGGKMGRGIALLLAREMTLQKLKTGQDHRLVCVDVNAQVLEGLKAYLSSQARKFAQKNRDALVGLYSGVTEPEILEDQFASELLATVQFSTTSEDARDSHLIFEAILENIDLKVSVFSRLRQVCAPHSFFFTNTSSIPIHLLNEKSGLEGRLIGFHFYNPPAVQKLVELIVPEPVHPELPEIARQLGKRLNKILIPSNDVAGFIGNGHFMRDGLHGIHEAERLKEDFSQVQSVHMINRVSQEFLIRPMGIFQLIDYVGLDVFQSILNIMNPYFPDENLHSALVDEMISLGVKGGQNPDGSQKDGFLQYRGGKITGVFDLASRKYVGVEQGTWREEADRALGDLPAGHKPWKELVADPERENRLRTYFQNLKAMDTLGARLALDYLKRSKEIGEQLVATGVANRPEDVNGVLMYGFYHLYGPINDFVY